MVIQFHDQSTVGDLKTQFSAIFPYLKIEFFRKKHQPFESSPKKDMVGEDMPLKNMTSGSGSGSFELSGEMTVAECEALFAKQLGLSCQVFRKSRNSWIETTRTDDWNLSKQNEEGQSISDDFSKSIDQRLEDVLPDTE